MTTTTTPLRYQPLASVRRVAEPGLPIRFALGRALRRLRTAAGYSEEQLGARAGLSPVQIARLERGEERVSLVMLEHLARSLGMQVSEFVSEAEREQRPGGTR